MVVINHLFYSIEGVFPILDIGISNSFEKSLSPIGKYKRTFIKIPRIALLRTMALDKNYIDTTTFDILQPAIDYYIKNGTPDEKLKTYYYQGRIYQNRQENDSALQCYAYGKEYRNQISDSLTMANLLVAQASIFFTIYKIDDFIKNNLDAARLFNKIGRFDSEVFCLTNVLDGSFIKEDRHLADSIFKIVKIRNQQYPGKTGADWDSAPEQTGTLLMLQS